MFAYALKRLLYFIPTLWAVLSLVFLLIHLVPGDPLDFILGDNAAQADRERLAEQLHLNEPIAEQYRDYLVGIFKGDWGKSFYDNVPVLKKIRERAAPTALLASSALLISVLIALPLGLIAAIYRHRSIDHAAMLVALLGISIPNFYLGPLLILLFAIHLQWLPVSGPMGWQTLLLPALTLGAALAAMSSRVTRSSMLEVLQFDYMRQARAKGVRPWRLYVRHGLRSGMLPIVTVIGLQFGVLLAGAVVTEKIFNWPGLGSLTLQAIQGRDYALVQGCILVIALSFMVVNLLTDLVYGWLDPRVKL